MMGVPVSERAACEGIVYTDSPVSYEENLRYCTESKCIIEILQHEASSPTFRTWEAISLNRKLLTSNQNIKTSPFYDERYVSIFHDEADIDWTFIEENNPYPDGNPYQEQISPTRLIEFMERELNIKIDNT